MTHITFLLAPLPWGGAGGGFSFRLPSLGEGLGVGFPLGSPPLGRGGGGSVIWPILVGNMAHIGR